MNVVFLNPSYPPEMVEFTRGLTEVGATVLGVGDSPAESLDPRLKGYLSHYLQVPRLLDEDDLVERVTRWLAGKPIDRVESTWEPLVVAAARLRENLGCPGMSVDTVNGFRDKEIMKARVAAAGLRVPRSAGCKSAEHVRKAAAQIGYPLIVKPIAGAGSADTYRVDSPQRLEEVIGLTGHVAEVSVEEFIEGEEFTFDCICVDGQPVFANVAQYIPKPLQQRTHEWISPIIITVRDMYGDKYRAGVELGLGVLKAMGMGDGFTHMEWFLKPDGEVVFGEIGCRPGGARLVDQMNLTCDVDLFREWARAVCWKSFEAPTDRKYNVAIIFKRAQGEGHITARHGLAEYMSKYHAAICAEELLPVGARRRNWKNTLVSDGYILVRHPDWDAALGLAKAAATDITLTASR